MNLLKELVSVVEEEKKLNKSKRSVVDVEVMNRVESKLIKSVGEEVGKKMFRVYVEVCVRLVKKGSSNIAGMYSEKLGMSKMLMICGVSEGEVKGIYEVIKEELKEVK